MSSNRETDLPRATSVRDKIEAVESKIQNVKQASSQSFVRVFPHKSPTETSTTSSVSSRLTVVDNDLFPKETTPSTYTVPSKTVHKPDEIHHQDCFDEAKESNKRGTFNQKLNQVTEYATTKVPEKKTLYRWPPSRTSPRIGIEKTSYYDYPSVPGRMKRGTSKEFRDSGACGMDYSDNDEEFTNESYWEKNRPVPQINLISSKESYLNETIERSDLVSLRYKVFETGTSILQRKDRFCERKVKQLLTSIEYLDCAGLCSRSAKHHELEIPLPIPLFYTLSQLNEWIGKNNKAFALSRSLRCPCFASALCVLTSINAKKIINQSVFCKFERQAMENLIQHAYDNRNYILFARLVHMCVMSKEDIHVHVFTNFFRKNEYTPTTCIAIDVIIAILINRIRRIQCFQKLKVRLSLCHRCNDKKFVFLLAYEGVIETNSEIPKLLLGIDLLLYNYRQQSDESISVSNSSAASSLKEKLPTMTEHMARTLFSQHSNLYMITASAFKSVKYSTENHRVDLKVCFRLFCQHKGYIPYGEKEFPRRLGEYEMDVLEGYCSFGMDTSLEIGGHIRRKGGASGSIGGFVKLLNGKIGLITCAHVLFSPEELLSGIFSNSVVEAFDKSSHTFKACGKIIDAKFPVSRKATEFSSASSITLENNIDAAVVELVPTINSFGFRAVPEDQLRSAGFDPGCLPAFPGKIIPVPIPDCSEKEQIQNVSGKIPGASESVIKFGASTGFTIGDLYFNRVHARFMNQHISFYGTDIGPIMCNQIEIRNLPQGDFFSMGDSGSFVFCINPNKTLSCIGMAIGLSPSGSCLVTPIDRILQSFGLPQTLESCYPGVSIKPDTTPINPVLENISRFMESIQIQLNDLNRKVQEIDDERKNK